MPKSDLDLHFSRIEQLVSEIRQFVPEGLGGATQFRADLAGLLVVSIASSYETCVKETLINYATRHHVAFGAFASNNYKKINSKITINDLYNYALLFDDEVHDRFKNRLKITKTKFDRLIGKNIEQSYKQILSWRHDYAHAGIRNTTIEEAVYTHRLARWVLYSFDGAFNHSVAA